MTKPTLHIRRLVILFTGVCIIGLFGGGFYAYRVHRIASHFSQMRVTGFEAAKQDKTSQAVDLFGEYLARYPNDVDVLATYGKLCPLVERPNNEHLARAMWALRHLLRIQPERLDARQELMGLYAATGYHAEALDCANTILRARLGNPSKSDLATQDQTLGTGEDGVNPRTEDAPKLRRYPDAIDAIAVRTRALLQLRKYPEALDACNRWVEISEAQIEPALIRAELLQDNHRSQEEAKALAAKWVLNHPSDPDNDLLTGHTELVYGFVQEGRAELTKAAAAKFTSSFSARLLIYDLDAVRQTELARTVVGRLFASDPKNAQTRFELIERDWETGHFTEVVDLYNDVRNDITTPTDILGQHATALLMLGKLTEAQTAEQPLIDRKDDKVAAAWLVILRQALDRQSSPQQIVDACGPALKQEPRDCYLRHFLAEADVRLGDQDLAAREWQHVVDQNLRWAMPAIELSAVLLDQGRTEPATQAAQEAAWRAPWSSDALIAWAKAWTSNIEANHMDGAERCLGLVNELCDSLKNDDRPIILRIRLLAAMGRVQQATELMQQSLHSDKSLSEVAWVGLASLSESRHMQLETQCLARAQKEHGITSTLAYSKAVAFFTAGESRKGLESFDSDAAMAPKRPTTQPLKTGTNAGDIGTNTDSNENNSRLRWDLARVGYLELIRDPTAAPGWAKLAESNPTQLRIQQLVLSVQSVRQDRDLSSRCIDRVRQLSSRDAAAWRIARARWLVSFGNTADELTEARGLLDELVQQTSDSAEVHLLSAMEYEHAGKLSSAVADLRIACNLSPNIISIRLYLARVLEMQGDFDAVREQLDHLTDADLQVTDQRQQAAALLAQQGQTDHAIALLEEDSRTGAEVKTASLLLAQLYQRRNELDKAEAILKKLLASQPDVAVLRFGADLYASRGRFDEAHALLNQLGNVGHTEPGVAELIRADFALEYESDTGPDKTIALYAAATKAAPTNPRTWRALAGAYLLFNRPEVALETASTGLRAVPGDPTLIAIAQQPEMLKYAAKIPELQPLLLFFVKDPSAGSAAANSLTAIYSAFLSQQPAETEAARLRELTIQYPRFAPLHVYLVNLYLKIPRVDDAINVATQAARTLPDSPAVARAVTEALRDAKRWPEALAAAERWRANVPADRLDADLVAGQALVGLRQPVNAINLLNPYVSNPKIAPDARILETYAKAQSNAGIDPDLAALMQPLLDSGAAGRLQWMRFAVFNLPAPEAEGWLRRAAEKMADKATPLGVTEQVFLSQAYSTLAIRADNAQYAQIARKILQPLASTDKSDPEVLLALGERDETDGDLKSAEDDYRRLLAVQPHNPAAENNLAMVLAKTGRAHEARIFIEEVIKALPNKSELYDTRAFVLSRDGAPDRALADIREAVRLTPAEPRYRLRLVQMLDDANRQHEAAAELKSLDSLPDQKSLSRDQLKQAKELRSRLAAVASTAVN